MITMVAMSFFERLALLCERADTSHRDLDRLAGLSEGHITMMLRRQSGRIENATAVALSETLGASLDWLLAGKGKPPSERDVRAAVERARSGTDSVPPPKSAA